MAATAGLIAIGCLSASAGVYAAGLTIERTRSMLATVATGLAAGTAMGAALMTVAQAAGLH